MRKHILILMLVLPLLLMSCVKNNKPTEDVLSEKMISETPESADEYIYINSDTGFPVFIPANWTGKYSIEHQENDFTLYHKATYEVNPDIGMLFRVQKRDGTVPDEWITENPGGAAYFQGDDYYIAFIVPTDVQYSDGTSEEYIEFAEQIDEIRRGIAVSMKDAGTNDYEDILTFPASSIADIPAPRPAGLEEEVYRFIL